MKNTMNYLFLLLTFCMIQMTAFSKAHAQLTLPEDESPYDKNDSYKDNYFSKRVLVKYYFNSFGGGGMSWDEDSLVIYDDGKVFRSNKLFGAVYVFQISPVQLYLLKKTIEKIPTDIELIERKVDRLSINILSYGMFVRNLNGDLIPLVYKVKYTNIENFLDLPVAISLNTEMMDLHKFTWKLVGNWSVLPNN